jgi:hypothetical protein
MVTPRTFSRPRASTATAATSVERGRRAELETLSARTLERLLLALREAVPARVWVRSTPVGATLSIDGTPVGVTPASLLLRPGGHSLALQLAGHRLAIRDLHLWPRQELSLSFPLQPLVDEESVLARRRPALRWLKWSLTAAGLVSAGIGAGLWAKGLSAPDDRYPAQLARPLDYRPAGISLAAVGAALVAGGAVCFVLDARGPRTSRGDLR